MSRRGQRPARHVSNSLDAVLAHFGRPSLDAHEVIRTRWSTIVGTRLAEWCWPSELVSGELVVSTTEPVVAEELKAMARDLAGTLNRLVGDDVVATVRVRVTSEGRSEGAPGDPAPGPTERS